MPVYGYKISEAAVKIGVSAEKLRYWQEHITLFNPSRISNQRSYTETDIQLGRKIKRLLEAGATIKKINASLQQESKPTPIPQSASLRLDNTKINNVRKQTDDLVKQVKMLIEKIETTLKH